MTAISDNKNILFQDLRVVAHRHAEITYEQEYPLAQLSLEQLGAFHSSLDTRISELQHEKVTTPTKEALLQEQEEKLIAYWGFRATAHKAQMLAREFSTIVAFLTPQPRLYLDETALGSEAPEVLKNLNTCDEASKKLMLEVFNWWGKIDTLQTKMFEELNREVSYSMQKFCQIVDRDGKPLNSCVRLIDYYTVPFIPKPQVKALKAETNPT